MAKSKRKKPDKHAKLKLASIPALLVVLGYVLWGQTADEGPSKVLLVSNPIATSVQTEDRAETQQISEAGAKDLSASQVPWPEPSLDFLEDLNPFDPYETPEPVEETKLVSTEEPEELENQVDVPKLLAEVAAELTTQENRFAFRSRNKNVLVIGTRELSAGEEIRDGVYLKSIKGQNLVLEYKPTDKGFH